MESLYKISKRGQGPEEYLSIRDFDVKENGDIYIFDEFGKNILVYNSERKYLSTINFDYYFENFGLVDNKIYLSKPRKNGKKLADLAIYNISNKKTTLLLNEEIHLYDIPILYSFYRFYQSPDNIYYSPKFSEIIYSVNNDNISPAIGIKNLPIPPNNIINRWLEENDSQKRNELIRSSNYFMENSLIFETNDYITLKISGGKSNDLVLYNKQSQQACKLFSYFVSKAIGTPYISGSTGNEFFSDISFNIDIDYHKEILDSREELKDFKFDDNPVIAFFTFDMESPDPLTFD